MSSSSRTRGHGVLSLKELKYLINHLIENLIEDQPFAHGGEIVFNKNSLRKLPLIFPVIFHKSCYYLDLKAIHVVAYSNVGFSQLTVEEQLAKLDHLMYVRDKEVIKSKKSKDEDDVFAESDQIDDSKILERYKDTSTVNVVNLKNWTCQCETYLIQLTNSDEHPLPICEHLLACHIWSLNKAKLSSYIDYKQVEDTEKWIRINDELTNPLLI